MRGSHECECVEENVPHNWNDLLGLGKSKKVRTTWAKMRMKFNFAARFFFRLQFLVYFAGTQVLGTSTSTTFQDFCYTWIIVFRFMFGLGLHCSSKPPPDRSPTLLSIDFYHNSFTRVHINECINHVKEKKARVPPRQKQQSPEFADGCNSA